MRNNTAANLSQYVIGPLTQFIEKSVERIYYTDIGDPAERVTNGKGIDIIAQQLIIAFEDNTFLYLSWRSVSGWEQYAISASTEPFVIADVSITNTYAVNSINWRAIIGRRLTGFMVYGYQVYESIRTPFKIDEAKTITYDNQPHLIILDFEESQVAIANFYHEADFEPKYPTGDDIWIIFDSTRRNRFVSELKLERLYTNGK